jgi:formylglycine-generating enzyme required for sulfatase activity
LNIRLLTRKKDWTPPQRKMMRKAARYHALRGVALLLVLLLLVWGGWEVYGRLRAEHLVESIVTAETADVPPLVEQLTGYRRWADARLLGHVQSSKEDSKEHLHASLALLPVDDSQVEYLHQRLYKAEPVELLVIRDALQGHKDALVGPLWGVLEDGQAQAERRFRAACTLAGYDVAEDEANRQRWQAVAPFVTEQLLKAVQKNPSHYTPLLQTLDPVRDRLVTPLSEVFHSGQADGDRSWAASFLSEYAGPDVLAKLLLDADARQFAVLWPKAEAQRQQVVATCEETLGTALEKQQTDAEKEELGKRQANAGVTLLRLGQAEKVWPLLRHRPDPRARSYLIDRLSPLGADPLALSRQLDVEKDLSIQRALLLSLGEFGLEQLPAARRQELLPRVWQLYREHADPGLHGAAEWLLRQWQQQDQIREAEQQLARDEHLRHDRLARIERALAKDGDRAAPQWYVNGQGQTLVVIPGPVEFLMGSPTTEAEREGGKEGKVETQHRRQIGRTFAVATKEVTVEQFRKCPSFKDYDYNKIYSPTQEHPVNGVSWYEAAEYCNWLSEQEGIPKEQWCYVPNDKGKFAAGMHMKPDYLSLTGYRLPTEAEWEFVCRAGAVTSRYYGETEELLGEYAWYTKNSQDKGMLLPGSLKPNDLGLFDLYGNALEWCQNGIFYYPRPTQGNAVADEEDKEDIKEIKDKQSRVLRGGSFSNQALNVRSADRGWDAPTNRLIDVGFRPARTFR